MISTYLKAIFLFVITLVCIFGVISLDGVPKFICLVGLIYILVKTFSAQG